MDDLIVELYKIGGIKFGSYTLKSGIESPVYLDLRRIISFPKILKSISELMWTCIEENDCQFDVLCGVPYTALPIATLMSTTNETPMLMRRKEAKDYGTKKMIEGDFGRGDYCLVVEDVITSGSSVQETAEALKAEGLIVKEVVVVIDRQQGGRENLKKKDIKVHSLMTISQIINVLQKGKHIDEPTVAKVQEFLKSQNSVQIPAAKKMKKTLSFVERMEHCKNPVAKKLFKIMVDKESNLALSADVSSAAQLLQMAEQLGPKICMLKTHIDILTDFSKEVAKQLVELAEKHNFVIFEDRKFADIGKTTKLQYSEGLYEISTWADIINAHTLPGPGVIDGLKEASAAAGTNKACVLIAEMTSAGNLFNSKYTEASVEMASQYPDFVIGFICTKRVSDNPQHIHMTPGINRETDSSELGQQYVTPGMAIKDRGTDIIIVGQGIIKAADPIEAAEDYRVEGFAAYKETL